MDDDSVDLALALAAARDDDELLACTTPERARASAVESLPAGKSEAARSFMEAFMRDVRDRRRRRDEWGKMITDDDVTTPMRINLPKELAWRHRSETDLNKNTETSQKIADCQ
jgi:hypothetical protein